MEFLSETTLLGVPKRHLTALKNSLVKSTIIASSQVGRNKAYFVIWHIIVSILSYAYPLRVDIGRPII